MLTKNGRSHLTVINGGGEGSGPQFPTKALIRHALAMIRTAMEMNGLNTDDELPHKVAMRAEIADEDLEMATLTLEQVLEGLG